MKTLLLLATTALLSAPAHARDGEVLFTCAPNGQPNALAIQNLAIDLDEIEPGATMTVSYANKSRPLTVNMAPYNDGHVLTLTPDSSEDGDLTVQILKQDGAYVANVRSRHSSGPTQLGCQEK